MKTRNPQATRENSPRILAPLLLLPLLAALGAGPLAAAPARQITFHDVAGDPAMHIGYRRAPSATDAISESIRQGGPTDIMNILFGPLKAKGAPGVALLDYDGDGDLDVYVTNGPGRANALYSNQLAETGRFSFVDVPDAAGAAATDQDSTGVCFGDTDNDGDPDLLVLGRGEPRRFFENLGGRFVDSTFAPGSDLGATSYTSSSCALADVDGDGLLDIFVANTFDWTTKAAILFEPYALNQPNQLFLNRGHSRFEDVSATSGLVAEQNDITWAVSMYDNDGDGDVDILTANDQGAIPAASYGGLDRGFMRLFLNDGHGHFTDVSTAAGFTQHGGYMGIGVADFDGDGRLDFVASNVGDWLDPLLNIPYTRGDQSSRWFMSKGNNTFNDPGLGPIGVSAWFWGTAAFDYDNDGDFDIVGYGGIDAGPIVDRSNAGTLFENDGKANFRFTHAPFENGAADHRIRNDHGLATGDLDGDGFLDIVSVSEDNKPPTLPNLLYPPTGYSQDGLATFIPLWHPTGVGNVWEWSGQHMLDGTLAIEMSSGGNGNGFVEVRTLGAKGLTPGAMMNRDGVGAIVKVTPKGGRTAMKPVLGGSSHASAEPMTIHVGLGRRPAATVEVVWQSGVRNRLYDVRRGERVRIPEIPCSFAARWKGGKAQYEACVDKALNNLFRTGTITREERDRLGDSAERAFDERH